MKDEDLGAKFGQEIRRRREALGLTLEDLAERSGLTPNYIGSVEIGKRDPSLSTILALAKGLGIQAGECFGTLPEISASGQEAATLFDESPAPIQTSILAVLRAVQKKAGKG